MNLKNVGTLQLEFAGEREREKETANGVMLLGRLFSQRRDSGVTWSWFNLPTFFSNLQSSQQASTFDQLF